ncbi:MAG: DUF58 domain-containing protein [Lachnospiraceae bacterium]|nr:DUF58 domain-containing protein [Lachnospiraceae bacterium]
MKIHVRPRQIISCGFAAVFIFIFALYCSGRVGWFLLLALILAPLLSVLQAYLCKNRLDISVSLSHDLMSKGEHCEFSLIVKNRSLLPCPPLNISMTSEPGIAAPPEYRDLSISVLPKAISKTTVTFTANLAGGCLIGAECITLSDHFGIVSVRLDTDGQYLIRAGVIPDIIRTDTATDLLLSVHDAFAADKNDETVDESTILFGGFPGYEYREYRPGDPLKRINSKLSAKRDHLMVRLDERQSSSNISLILDPFMKENDPELSQAVLEETLGMILSLINLDFSVSFCFLEDEKWICEKIFKEDTLISISRRLARHMFTDGKEASFPSWEEPGTHGVIICQADSASKTTSQLSGKGLHIYSVSSGEWRHT